MAPSVPSWLRLAAGLLVSVPGALACAEQPARSSSPVVGEVIAAAEEPIPSADEQGPARREFKSTLIRRSVMRVADASYAGAANRPAPAAAELSEQEAGEPAPLDDAAEDDSAQHDLSWEPKPEVIQERYPNRKIRVEREVTQDNRGNYLNHGTWKMWDTKGTLAAEGQYVNGERQGTWYRWHLREDSPLFVLPPYDKFSPPFVSQATFQNGELHGAWVIFDAKQRKISEWNFADGKRHGKSTWWHPSGQKMREMDYKEGALDGELLDWNEAAQLTSKATYQDGRKLAARTETFPDGHKRSEGTYLHAAIVLKQADDWWNAAPATFTTQGKDERHGEWTSWYATGQEQMRGKYQNDEEEGLFTWWYPNGQKAVEGEFVSGRQNGKWMWWHNNGQKATQGAYQSGEQTGRWTVWDTNGKVTQASDHNQSSTVADQIAPKTEGDVESARLPRPVSEAGVNR